MARNPLLSTLVRPLLAALALTLAFAPSAIASATPHDNQGTIKVHDAASESPPTQNDPHVSCGFWVEGFNMEQSQGTLVFWAWPPTGDKSVVKSDNWTGTPEADQSGGYHFLNGMYDLPAGHYRVQAFSDEGHPGNFQAASKTKEFWVDPCDVPCTEECPPPPCQETQTCPPPPVCPTDLAAEANGDGSVTVSWTAAVGSNGTNLYRAVGGGDMEFVATLPDGTTTYQDTTTVPGTSYTYLVAGVFGAGESKDCSTVVVTAVPDFPTALGIGVAGLATLGVAVLLRRRA